MMNPSGIPVRYLIGAIFAIALIGVVAFALIDYTSVDSCLDRGGRWDSARQECQGAEQR